MPTCPPIPPDVAELTAPLLYVYIYNFPGDRVLFKLLVYTIFLLETVQTVLTGVDLYLSFASGFGHMYRLTRPNMSAFDVPIIESMVSLTVQLFFAYRVWILSDKKSWWFCLAICVCSTVGATAAFTGGIYIGVRNKFASGLALRVLAFTWLIGGALADIFITATMLYQLTRRRTAGNGFLSNRALSRIVRFTIETNVLTTSIAIVSLLLVAIFPHKNWFTYPTAILGKIYSNTLLASLNNRIALRAEESTGRREVAGIGSQAAVNHRTVPSGDAVRTTYIELGKVPRTLQERTPSGGDDGQEIVIDIL
ncbi:hypothetical protein BGW80DRAFT_564598 [Lactifluus volemus]|nr:hypothetical protein BGW80DRAFT_564598 [Lactifluus volemus]